MASAENAKIQIETGQTHHAMAVMTDSGDHQVHTVSGGNLWSGKSGFTPDVRPNGIVSGRNLLSTNASNDTVSIAAFTAYSKGELQSVSATTTTITRTATTGVSQVHSITMASDGSIAVVEGTVGSDQTFSETRNAAGGPPYIPDESVEIGQIRVTSSTAAAIASTEIFQVIGTHTERYDNPVWIEKNVGDGEAADSSAEKYAHIKFQSALQSIHTGGTVKHVYMSYNSPNFAEMQRAMDFTPAENTHSVSSTQYYRGTVASASKSLGQGGFTALLTDGVSDAIIAEQDEKITAKFYPDEDESPYIITQGHLGIKRSFPVDNQIQAVCTLTAEDMSASFQS